MSSSDLDDSVSTSISNSISTSRPSLSLRGGVGVPDMSVTLALDGDGGDLSRQSSSGGGGSSLGGSSSNSPTRLSFRNSLGEARRVLQEPQPEDEEDEDEEKAVVQVRRVEESIQYVGLAPIPAAA